MGETHQCTTNPSCSFSLALSPSIDRHNFIHTSPPLPQFTRKADTNNHHFYVADYVIVVVIVVVINIIFMRCKYGRKLICSRVSMTMKMTTAKTSIATTVAYQNGSSSAMKTHCPFTAASGTKSSDRLLLLFLLRLTDSVIVVITDNSSICFVILTIIISIMKVAFVIVFIVWPQPLMLWSCLR